MGSCVDGAEARTQKQKKYDEAHTKRVSLKLNLKNDEDIILWMQKQHSIQGSIKALIRQQIASEQNSNLTGYWNFQTQVTAEQAKAIEEVIKECDGNDEPIIPDYMNRHAALKEIAKTDKKKFGMIADYITDRLFYK